MSIQNFFKSLTSTPTRRRPAPCRLGLESLEDRCTPSAMLAIGDMTILEGNAGTRAMPEHVGQQGERDYPESC